MWPEGLSHSLALEKLTLMIEGKYSIFEKMWRYFMGFLDRGKSFLIDLLIFVYVPFCFQYSDTFQSLLKNVLRFDTQLYSGLTCMYAVQCSLHTVSCHCPEK